MLLSGASPPIMLVLATTMSLILGTARKMSWWKTAQDGDVADTYLLHTRQAISYSAAISDIGKIQRTFPMPREAHSAYIIPVTCCLKIILARMPYRSNQMIITILAYGKHPMIPETSRPTID